MNKSHKIVLPESKLPHSWFRLSHFLQENSPLVDPQTNSPVTYEALSKVFTNEGALQELDFTTEYVPIPESVQEFYSLYRPSPLIRARELERYLDTPARIYFKFEGNNTSGSHKLNSAIPQAYYAKEQGLCGLTTETGAGQWGSALSMACAHYGLDLKVYMVRCSYQQKPMRKDLMNCFGANVIPSPSLTTNAGRTLLDNPCNQNGSLGSAISEAVETAVSTPGYRYVLGSVLNQVLLHQSIIGLECETALQEFDDYPDLIIGCAGGGSNLGGLIAPFMRDRILQKNKTRFLAVEPSACPSLTQGDFRYDFCDASGITPKAKMYTLGYDFMPEPTHAGGLRYHGMSPILSQLHHDGLLDAIAVDQPSVFQAALTFARCETILPAPESAHAIYAAIQEALKCKKEGTKKSILFGLTGTGQMDLSAYQLYLDHKMS